MVTLHVTMMYLYLKSPRYPHYSFPSYIHTHDYIVHNPILSLSTLMGIPHDTHILSLYNFMYFG